MSRMMSFFALGVLALGYTLANPATSQAQTRVGVHIGVGPVHVDLNRGYYGSSYWPSYSRYDYYPRPPHGGHHHHYGHHHHRYHHHRDVIVVPSYYHWTPDRGYHSHGSVIVPHRGHYHVRPY